MGRNFTIFALFYFICESKFHVQAPQGLNSERRFNRGVFCVTILRGLYLEGLIHGGAYFQNFTVFNQIKFFLKHLSLVLNNNKLILITNKEAGANLNLTFLRDVGYIIFIFNKSYKNKYRP